MSDERARVFNDVVKSAIENAIRNLLGSQVLDSLYENLRKHHDITRDKVVLQLDALFGTLEETFGFAGARTISRTIARDVYARMGLQFMEVPNYRLQDYLESAKKQLANR